MKAKLARLKSALNQYNFQKVSELIQRLEDNEHVKIAILDNSDVSEGIRYHLEHNRSLFDPIFRHASFSYFNMMKEAAELHQQGKLYLDDEDERLMTPDIGSFAEYEGMTVPLDFPMEAENVEEFSKLARKKKKKKKKKHSDKPLGKPMKNTGGGKKWVVYVKNPKTGNIKKITYGDGNMKANWNDPDARASFAARHKCEQKKDRTKAGYWACRAHKDFGKNVSGRYW